MNPTDENLRALLRGQAPPPPSLPPDAIRAVGTATRRSLLLTSGTIGIVFVAAIVSVMTWLGVDDSNQATSADGGYSSRLFIHADSPVEFAAKIPPTSVLRQEGECLMIDDHPAVWPSGTKWQDSDTLSVRQDGATFALEIGDPFPQGMSGGLMPINLVGKSLVDGQTQDRLAACLPNGIVDVFVVN